MKQFTIEGNYKQRHFLRVVMTTPSAKNQDRLYKWAKSVFGPPSTRWNWCKTSYGALFQFAYSGDCLLFKLTWKNN